ncbi:hypothetical protein [Paenibacillus endoradicis]|uniref:hypothetical protein n=1 Tax=Paenibacillus endoradicis TaxID=2972487 RepID=UPI002158C0DD|nr:hypothetical protein [Paenibacillus endoradicis]MCR8659117.1 hypothetical protein [Paenibacillus endoradicis]
MYKKHVIYKRDKYNMLTVEVQGKTLVIREISDQWGEEGYQFISRPEMLHWAANHFLAENFIGREDELKEIMDNFRNV